MKTRQTSIVYGLLIIGLLAGGLAFASLSRQAPVSDSSARQVAGSAQSTQQPMQSLPQRTEQAAQGWEKASPEEVGRQAIAHAKAMGDVRDGTPQVMLARSVRNDELPGLEVSCPYPFDTIEEPPLMLVVLKGDFLPQSSHFYSLTASHVAYVYDLWAQKPLLTVWSAEGSRFRQLLNDPSLPTPFPGMALDCPASPPVARTHHYGEPVPPTVQPTQTALDYVPPLATISPGNLLGKSPDEVAQYAVETLQRGHEVKSGTPQVLLARAVSGQDMQALGLGCEYSSAIEQAPWVLVILKGDFQLNLLGATIAPMHGTHYVALVYDMWAGSPTSITSSPDGVGFGSALNDPALPTQQPYSCPTEEPYAKSSNTRHYGNTAPGLPVPPPRPSLPTPTQGTPPPSAPPPPLTTAPPSVPPPPLPIATLAPPRT